MSDTKHQIELTTEQYRTVVAPGGDIDERVDRILEHSSTDLKHAIKEEIDASVGPDTLTQMKARATLALDLTIEK